MAGSTVVITGANRGIGLEFTRQYLNDGWNVISTLRDSSNSESLDELQSQYSDNLQIQRMDVTQSNTIDKVTEKLKGESISVDLLLNNAGVMGSKESFEELDANELRNVFDTNGLGAFLVTQKFLPLMKKSGSTVAMITSLMGSIEDNRSGGSYAYRISKASLNMFGKTLSVDLKDDKVTVLLLHPGWVRTRMGGENAKIEVEESVSGLRSVISNSGLEDSGKFYNYEGQEMPW